MYIGVVLDTVISPNSYRLMLELTRAARCFIFPILYPPLNL